MHLAWFGLLLTALALAGEPALETWARALPNPEPVPGHAAGYRYSGAIFGQIAEWVRERPGVIEPEHIGTSAGGRPLWAFHVTEPGVPVGDQVLVLAGIHALEWISTEVAFDLLGELVALPPRGTRVTVVPLWNPDGRARVEGDLLEGRIQYRRGNERNVDLNRDFAVHREARAVWKIVIPGYYASSPAPLSQPESRAVDALLARERYDRAASLHAFGGYLYHPWSGAWRRPEDWASFVHTGRAMERAQTTGAYRTRQLSRWGFFFRAHGTELDHMYGQYGTQAWLVELTRSGFDIRRPRDSIRRVFRWYNPKNPEPHRKRGVAAMRALIRAE